MSKMQGMLDSGGIRLAGYLSVPDRVNWLLVGWASAGGESGVPPICACAGPRVICGASAALELEGHAWKVAPGMSFLGPFLGPSRALGCRA